MKYTLVLVLLCSTALTWAQDSAIPDMRPYTQQYALVVNEIAKGFYVGSANISNQNKGWSTVENFTFGKDRGNMPMINDLQALHPYFRDKVQELIQICKAKGIELAVVETFRTHAKQNEYKTMGKKFTRSAGGSSKHQYGLAIDVVPMVKDSAEWHNLQLWKKIGAVGEQLGLRWGGRWKNPYDPGHFEWTNGLSSAHLAAGMLPKIPTAKESYSCIDEDLAQLMVQWKEWESNQGVVARQESSSPKSK
jgi:D-alanyl-D-alanine carboxypeptidase.